MARLSAFCAKLAPAFTLATVGVGITTGIFGNAAYYLTGFTWFEFFLLRVGNINLCERVRSTLEIESGTNDPIATFLTITLVEIIALCSKSDADLLFVGIVDGFFVQMILSVAMGLLGSFLIVKLV